MGEPNFGTDILNALSLLCHSRCWKSVPSGDGAHKIRVPKGVYSRLDNLVGTGVGQSSQPRGRHNTAREGDINQPISYFEKHGALMRKSSSLRVARESHWRVWSISVTLAVCS